MNTVSAEQLMSLERAYKNSARHFRGRSSSELLGAVSHDGRSICEPCYEAMLAGGDRDALCDPCATAIAPYDITAEPRKYSAAQTAIAFAAFFVLAVLLAMTAPFFWTSHAASR